MFNGPIEDRLQIRELYDAYSDATNQQNVDAWLANWCEDGVWRILGQEIRGREALRRQWDLIWQGVKTMGFFAEIGAISVDGDHARGRSYCREIVSLKNGSLMKVVACYRDQLRKEQGVWRFASRDYTLMIHESDMEGNAG